MFAPPAGKREHPPDHGVTGLVIGSPFAQHTVVACGEANLDQVPVAHAPDDGGKADSLGVLALFCRRSKSLENFGRAAR